jgi:hypothetical protein
VPAALKPTRPRGPHHQPEVAPAKPKDVVRSAVRLLD